MNENKFLKKLEAFNFFQIEVIADFEYEGKIYKNHKQYNNDSILNSNNWELHKETFFNQRMNFYKESYTLSEKIKLEIEALENLTINETDYKILKDRYNSFLSNKQNPPQQVENVKPDEVKNIHPKFNPNYWNKECFELFKYIYDEYYKGTKRQLTNIWFYLKECQNTNYILKATKEQYETFILENYQIKITNFDKAQTKWEDKEYGTINDHRINFEDSLK